MSGWILDTLKSRDVRRAVGCPEIEQRCRELAKASDAAGAAQLARLLAVHIASQDVQVVPTFVRIGAIVSCASAAIGFGRPMTTAVLLSAAMPLLTMRLRDPAEGVALAACEAVYNIARVVRGDFVKYIPGIVEALCALSSSAIGAMHQAHSVLNRLVMDLVCECRDWGGGSDPDGDGLLHNIVAVTIAGMRGGVEAGVCFSLEWVSVLETSPDIGQELLEGYPELIKVSLSPPPPAPHAPFLHLDEALPPPLSLSSTICLGCSLSSDIAHESFLPWCSVTSE